MPYSTFYLQWHITNRCNYRCTHCYQTDYSDSEISLNDFITIANNIFNTITSWGKNVDISLTGGEPFVRKDLFDILLFLNSSYSVKNIDILCNGTLINSKIIQFLKNIDKLKYIQVSLDGSTPLTHDKIRGNNAFNKALEGIRLLVKNGFRTKIMFTLQRSNMHEVPSLIDLALNENIDGLTIERLVPTGSSKNRNDLVLSSNEIKSIFEYVSKRSDQEYNLGSHINILKYRPLWILIDPCRTYSYSETPTMKDLGAICSIGLDGLCILPDATVLACRRLPIPIGNLIIDSFEKIWFTSALLLKIRDKGNLKGKCRNCLYIPRCSGCRAMAYAITGDFLEEDPQCWINT